MDLINVGCEGAAVEDVQRRLAKLGYDLGNTGLDGSYETITAAAVKKFRSDYGLPDGESVDAMMWAALVDATYSLGDRTLYLRMPYFHGNDVGELQNILNILGFACGPQDSIFGAYTERGVRDFQTNMGLEPDGIVGMATTNSLSRLHRAWTDKTPLSQESAGVGFSRAADVLEKNPVCIYGIDDVARKIASSVCNLAFATTSLSKVLSADKMSAAPNDDFLMIEITTGDCESALGDPLVVFDTPQELMQRFRNAVESLDSKHKRIIVRFNISDKPTSAQERDEDLCENYGRGIIQHSAIILLDAICCAFVK